MSDSTVEPTLLVDEKLVSTVEAPMKPLFLSGFNGASSVETSGGAKCSPAVGAAPISTTSHTVKSSKE